MSRDVGIADRLRAHGLTVVEVAGWQTRGSATFDPRGSVDHHTAGPDASHGPCPSLGVVINGRPDLPGPLCNVLLGRDNVCYVVAAGKANHAGLGAWRGLSGNSSVYGIERENVGTDRELFTDAQNLVAARAHAALIDRPGLRNAALACEHREWAPTRKVDAWKVTGDLMRVRVAAALTIAPPTPAPPGPLTVPQEDDMAAATHPDGHHELFDVALGGLVHNWQDAGDRAAWSGWQPLDKSHRYVKVMGATVSPPGTVGAGNVNVFARFDDSPDPAHPDPSRVGLVALWYDHEASAWRGPVLVG